MKKIGKQTIPLIVLVLFVAFLLGMTGVSLVREYGQAYFSNHCNQPDQKLVEQWLNAVREGNMGHALLYASQIVPDDDPELPRTDYLKLMHWDGLNTMILTDSFNKVDFYRWRDAFGIRTLIQSLAKRSGNEVENLLQGLLTQVKWRQVKGKKFPPFSIMEIWERGYGNNADRVRVFCELVKQAGYYVQVVALLNKKGRQMHLFCELRKKGGVAVVDIMTGNVWNGKSVGDLKKNTDLLPDKWPDKFKKAIQNCVYLYPTELADYRLVNQKLYQRISKASVNNIPVFGQDPQKSIERYVASKPIVNRNRCGYWQTPLMAIFSCPDFPRRWYLFPNKKSQAKK